MIIPEHDNTLADRQSVSDPDLEDDVADMICHLVTDALEGGAGGEVTKKQVIDCLHALIEQRISAAMTGK